MFRMRNNLVGVQVKLARQQQLTPISQERLAELLQLRGWDISRSGIAKIEIGLRQVTDIEAMHLARALSVSVTWLFGEGAPDEADTCA